MNVHDRIASQLPAWRDRVARLKKEYGNLRVGEVTVDQIYGGIRGVQIQISDISYVDPLEGIRLRGYSIPEVVDLLPKRPGTEYPMAGGLFYLLLADTLPTEAEALEVEEEWRKRSALPDYLAGILRAMPEDSHPMTMFSTAILALQNQSVFAQRYSEGLPKADYWEAFLEDSFCLTAKLPGIAALIYNMKFKNERKIEPDPNLDWGASFAHLIGKDDDKLYMDLCRLFLVIHSDHEGGNVSAHTAHLVCSALSDIYLTSSAAMNGLAGPLHGLANQECLGWLLDVHKLFHGVPARDDLYKFAWDTLNSGKVIPGYGHAVLRVPDPRYMAQMKFAKERFPQDELVRLADMVFDVVPAVLKEQGKAKNPAPNVDAISGTLQYYYGVRDFDFYTVLFGVGRALGVTANYVWARALGQPLERPKSLSTKMLEDVVAKAAQPA